MIWYFLYSNILVRCVLCSTEFKYVERGTYTEKFILVDECIAKKSQRIVYLENDPS